LGTMNTCSSLNLSLPRYRRTRRHKKHKISGLTNVLCFLCSVFSLTRNREIVRESANKVRERTTKRHLLSGFFRYSVCFHGSRETNQAYERICDEDFSRCPCFRCVRV